MPYTLWANDVYAFRVYLKNKGCSHNISPESFLSGEALERRSRFLLEVTESDRPISSDYVDILASTGALPVVQSKWFATVVMASEDSLVADRLSKLPIVDSVKWVWKGSKDESPASQIPTERIASSDSPLANYYGYAERQIKMLNGMRLHKKGFQGEGMRIAVIDAGFLNVDRIVAFDSLRLLGTRNIISPGRSVFREDNHGTKVLSCLAANQPGVMVGTAPKASYLLIKSEDCRSEYPIEEDYWAAAAEYADSMGVDVITSSVGYFAFDGGDVSYDKQSLDGKTSFISRAACKAAEKGILVFCSAGNEGAGQWEKIVFPSDGMGVLTVGSINESKQKSSFSSVGFTSDFRVKPDVVALGSGSCVMDESAEICFGSGTSFSTPIVAGLGTCLWQAYPSLSNKEIIALIQELASQYKKPDSSLGYGIPNFYKSYKKQRKRAR